MTNTNSDVPSQEAREAADNPLVKELRREMLATFNGDAVPADDHEAATIMAIALLPIFARFEQQVRADERERCAKVASAHQTNGKRMFGYKGRYDDAAEEIATAIRALAEQGR